MTEPTALPGGKGVPDRGLLVELISGQLGPRDSTDADALRRQLVATLEGISDADLARFSERVRTTGRDWGYHPPDPVARRLSRVVLDVVFEHGSALEGGERLAPLRGRPLVFLANHLSFADANVLEHLLVRDGQKSLAAGLVVMAGPKVYSRTLRRLASLCFGTIKLPQSSSRASGEARMPTREVARLAAETLRCAHERLAFGQSLLVFVEGTRSRTRALQRALGGVARYLDFPGAVVVPVGLSGSERLVPIDEVEALHRTRVTARIGAGFPAAKLQERCGRNRTLLMDVVGFQIAALLPPAYRGVYAGGDPALEPARAIAECIASEPRG